MLQAASAQLTQCDVHFSERFLHIFSGLIGPTAHKMLTIFSLQLKTTFCIIIFEQFPYSCCLSLRTVTCRCAVGPPVFAISADVLQNLATASYKEALPVSVRPERVC